MGPLLYLQPCPALLPEQPVPVSELPSPLHMRAGFCIIQSLFKCEHQHGNESPQNAEHRVTAHLSQPVVESGKTKHQGGKCRKLRLVRDIKQLEKENADYSAVNNERGCVLGEPSACWRGISFLHLCIYSLAFSMGSPMFALTE